MPFTSKEPFNVNAVTLLFCKVPETATVSVLAALITQLAAIVMVPSALIVKFSLTVKIAFTVGEEAVLHPAALAAIRLLNVNVGMVCADVPLKFMVLEVTVYVLDPGVNVPAT